MAIQLRKMLAGTHGTKCDTGSVWTSTPFEILNTKLAQLSPSGSSASSVTGIVDVPHGGTNITSYSIGDLLVATAATVLSQLAFVNAPTRYLANTGSGIPAWDQIDLTNGVKNRVPYANVTAATAASRLLGRGSAGGGGDWQEVSLGTGLTLTGTVLSAGAVGAGPQWIRPHQRQQQ